MALPRSYLFVPADRPERFAKALASGADAVILDLEDAVAPAAKEGARAALAGWLAGLEEAAPHLWIRINPSATAWHDADLALTARSAIGGVVLPKTEQASALRDVAARLAPGQRLLPLIESAAGLAGMRELARVERVERLLFGSIDLQLDLGMQCDEQESELAHWRAELVLASRLAGIAPPVDGVTVALDDEAALEGAVARARRMGFGAKLCIHPRQVAGVNRGFLPGEKELGWASRVLAAVAASGGAAVAVDGKMVDAPVIALAQRLLQEAQR
ncbi:HpcH/HpaI aldolase/citrate lyase family protein [Noviherbaspirillum sedimenti]|uniref:CoA ester lyase n=1 Tax=Noviherbaspirillum sedimenti TaxID=2320865 RepID=A0A3A3G369_9BURK|nr:CoA ester lyase [Noviherbaspirillum sedimenti]RJG02917.1 CoA ester lyase [Noviherbaspirillum sedimenti]